MSNSDRTASPHAPPTPRPAAESFVIDVPSTHGIASRWCPSAWLKCKCGVQERPPSHFVHELRESGRKKEIYFDHGEVTRKVGGMECWREQTPREVTLWRSQAPRRVSGEEDIGDRLPGWGSPSPAGRFGLHGWRGEQQGKDLLQCIVGSCSGCSLSYQPTYWQFRETHSGTKYSVLSSYLVACLHLKTTGNKWNAKLYFNAQEDGGRFLKMWLLPWAPLDPF